MHGRRFAEWLEPRFSMTADVIDLVTFGAEEWSPLFSNEERFAGSASVAELADFNKDGVPDIAFGTAHTRWALTEHESLLGVALGNVQGEFVTQSEKWIHDDLYSITPIDLNGDGWLDIVAGGVFKLNVLFSQVDAVGQWIGLTDPVTLGGASDSVQVYDINSDGHLDILAAPTEHFHVPWDTFENSTFSERDTDHLHIYLGDGAGDFAEPLQFRGEDRLILVDFDQDGDQDIVTGMRDGPARSDPLYLQVLLNNGRKDVDFELGETLPSTWDTDPRFRFEYFVNDDVYPDVVWSQDIYDFGSYNSPRKTVVAFGRPDGGHDGGLPITNTHFGLPVGYFGFGGVYDVPRPFFYDVDGNGETDFIQVSGQHVVISRQGTLGTYAAAAFNYPSISDQLSYSRFWDLNKDGFLDFVAVDAFRDEWEFRLVQYGQPDGTFGDSQRVQEETIQSFLTEIDEEDWLCCFAEEPSTDGVVTRHDEGGVSVRVNTEKFQIPVANQTVSFGPDPKHDEKQVDIDNDGDLDLLIGHGSGIAVVLSGALPKAGAGDANEDGRINTRDLRAIREAWQTGDDNSPFDINNDQLVDQADEQHWIEEIAMTKLGDLNLDGRVGFDDFLRLVANMGKSESFYSRGDVDGDGTITKADFEHLRQNFG